MKIKNITLIVVLLLIGLVGTALAADPAKRVAVEKEQCWVNIFPIGTEIHSFAVDPQDNRLYASTPKGLFVSVDDGKLWFFLSGFKGQELSGNIIRISPTSPKTLYWGISFEKGSMGGVYKSKDGGITWEDIGAGVIKDGIHDIALHPKNPEIIYVASEGGLYKTLNGGKTWGKIAGPAYSVFLNPESPEEVYASLAVEYGWVQLHYSKDGGQTFNRIKLVTTARFGEEECGDLNYASLNPHNTYHIFSICSHTGGWYSFVKSNDGGKTWETIFEASGAKLKSWAWQPKKDVIYAIKEDRVEEKDKIIKSSDGAKTWTSLSSPPSQNISNIEIPFPDTIYVTTDYGIYKTTDDGKSWEPRSFGLPVKIGGRELKWVATNSGIIYVGSNKGYWASDDKGLSWKWQSLPETTWGGNDYPNQIFITQDQTTWEVFHETTAGYQWRVFKTPFGQKPIKINIPNYHPRYLVVSPSNSKVIYLTATGSNAWSQEKNPPGGILLKSEDGGFSWTQIDWQRWLQIEQGTINLLSVDPRSPDILYAVVKHTQHFSFIKTTDGGKTWTDISRNLYGSIESAWSSSKWLNPKERHHIANLLLSSPASVVIDPSNSNIVYITTSRGGVYRSDDGGKNWKLKSPMDYLKRLVGTFDNYSVQECNKKGRKDCKVTLYNSATMKRWQVGFFINVPPNYVVVRPEDILNRAGVSFNNISINPSEPKIVYLATNVGVYRSSDRGDTWQLVNDGLLDIAVKRVMASLSFVLAEGENGIYKLPELSEEAVAMNTESNINNIALDKPKTPYEDQGACPFECCTYRTWVAKRDIVIRKDMNEKSPVVFKVRKGEKVTGITGVVVTTTPGVAKVIKATNIDGEQANVGDTVYVLTYSGEGVYKILV